MSAGYVLAETFKGYTLYFVSARHPFARALMSSRVTEARTWATPGGARNARHKYRLTRTKVVKAPNARLSGEQLPLIS